MADGVDEAVNSGGAVVRNWKYPSELVGNPEDCDRRDWCRGPGEDVSKQCVQCWKESRDESNTCHDTRSGIKLHDAM